MRFYGRKEPCPKRHIERIGCVHSESNNSTIKRIEQFNEQIFQTEVDDTGLGPN